MLKFVSRNYFCSVLDVAALLEIRAGVTECKVLSKVHTFCML